MATIVRCNCGAEYKRTETKFLVPHTGDAGCTVCGAALESWSESTHVPSFELVKRPDGNPPQKPLGARNESHHLALESRFCVAWQQEFESGNVPDGAWRATRSRRNPVHGTHCYLAGTA